MPCRKLTAPLTAMKPIRRKAFLSGNATTNEKMSGKFEAEQAELTQALASLETEIAAEESQAVNVDRFLSVVRRYTEIEELTPAIVHEFIDRIIVYEPEQARGDRRQKVEIIYNNVGAVDRLALWYLPKVTPVFMKLPVYYLF